MRYGKKIIYHTIAAAFLSCSIQPVFSEELPPPITSETQPATPEASLDVMPGVNTSPPDAVIEPPLMTLFECISTDVPNKFATIAKRGDRVSPPMITWQLTQFYGPQQRCNIVSQRLTDIIKDNGGKYGNLLLTYGKVNNVPVICHVKSQRGYCKNNNVLLTLAPRDKGKEASILKSLINFGTEASGGPLLRGERYVDLGVALETYLGDE